jgi:hypothetical protein
MQCDRKSTIRLPRLDASLNTALSRFLAWAMDAKMTSNAAASTDAWHKRYGEVGTLFLVHFSDQRLIGVTLHF